MNLDDNEYKLIRAALDCLAQDHRDAETEANNRANDPAYEFRREAIRAACFHADERNKISRLSAKIAYRQSAA